LKISSSRTVNHAMIWRKEFSPVVHAGVRLNLLLTMDTRMWIREEIDYRTMISCYFIRILDTHKRICHKTMIDTVLAESAKMIWARELDQRKPSYAVLGSSEYNKSTAATPSSVTNKPQSVITNHRQSYRAYYHILTVFPELLICSG